MIKVLGETDANTGDSGGDAKGSGGGPLKHSGATGEALGAYYNDPVSGKGLIHLLANANRVTPMHEIGHFLRDKWLDDSGLKRVERALGVRDGKWTREHEEAFAAMHIAYLLGTSASPELDGLFAHFRSSFKEVLSAANHQLDPKVKVVFDRIYGQPGFNWGSLRSDLGDPRLKGLSASSAEYRKRIMGSRNELNSPRSRHKRLSNNDGRVPLDGGKRYLHLSPDEMRQFLMAR
jgi:hypothetical protein